MTPAKHYKYLVTFNSKTDVCSGGCSTGCEEGAFGSFRNSTATFFLFHD